ncbi:hypothetical protein [Rhizobium sp. RU36D]|uniref:hypothetical protein n=1 Tax=Rhizobium sp. RU36D TaxID=1907415 RepID=UPI0009D79B77|nr:hypothetical protein [Rhizobium sp. RU36D]SMC40514.1 hypothetical protein SAMN05880593_101109 [Rhizobium sp. RU36D]
MAIQDSANSPLKRSSRVMWVAAAIIAVFVALGAVHLLGNMPIFGVKAIPENGEMPVEEHPVTPAE